MVRKLKKAERGDRLREALERRYPAPEFALFHEVASGVGGVSTRYLDAVAMGLFPSRGLYFHGFELKRDRKDWLREKKSPEKAEVFGPSLDYFWIVTTGPEIAREDEIPDLWGLIELDGDLLVVKRKACFLHPEHRSLDRAFIAAILRRAHEQKATSGIVRASYERGRREGEKRAREFAKTDLEMAKMEERHARDAVEAFENASGISISRWNAGKLGQAVELLTQGPKPDILRELTTLAKDFDEIGTSLRAKATAFELAWKAFSAQAKETSSTP